MIRVWRGDITTMDVDAIVNAANGTLLGGGGADGAVHHAAGPGLLEECRALGGCGTGQAKMTAGHALRARHVIYTVGPIWCGGDAGERALLAGCYRASLDLAEAAGCRSIAFPAISTGAYGFPHDEAAMIAVATVSEALPGLDSVEEVLLVSLDARTERHLRNAARKAGVDVR